MNRFTAIFYATIEPRQLRFSAIQLTNNWLRLLHTTNRNCKQRTMWERNTRQGSRAAARKPRYPQMFFLV